MHELKIDFGQPVAIFPLPQCLLLPHATLPLHIFENRYRQMFADVIQENHLVAMAIFDGGDWKNDYHKAPTIREIVCVGHVLEYQRLADGRFNILLQGICRAEIEMEVQAAPYRTALLRPLENPATVEEGLSPFRKKIITHLNNENLQELSAIHNVNQWLTPDVPTSALIDVCSTNLCLGPEERYKLLANPVATDRAQWLTSRLLRTQKSVEMAMKYGVQELPDHIYLN